MTTWRNATVDFPSEFRRDHAHFLNTEACKGACPAPFATEGTTNILEKEIKPTSGPRSADTESIKLHYVCVADMYVLDGSDFVNDSKCNNIYAFMRLDASRTPEVAVMQNMIIL